MVYSWRVCIFHNKKMHFNLIRNSLWPLSALKQLKPQVRVGLCRTWLHWKPLSILIFLPKALGAIFSCCNENENKKLKQKNRVWASGQFFSSLLVWILKKVAASFFFKLTRRRIRNFFLRNFSLLRFKVKKIMSGFEILVERKYFTKEIEQNNWLGRK